MNKIKAIAIANSLWNKIMEFEGRPFDKFYTPPYSEHSSNGNLKLLANEVVFKHEHLTEEEMYLKVGFIQGCCVSRGISTYKEEIARIAETEINLAKNKTNTCTATTDDRY